MEGCAPSLQPLMSPPPPPFTILPVKCNAFLNVFIPSQYFLFQVGPQHASSHMMMNQIVYTSQLPFLHTLSPCMYACATLFPLCQHRKVASCLMFKKAKRDLQNQLTNLILEFHFYRMNVATLAVSYF